MDSIKLGTSISKNIGIGKAFIVKSPDLSPILDSINEKNIEKEIEKFNIALDKTVADIEILAKTSDIFSAHLEIALDPTLTESVKSKINNELQNAQLALTNATDEICVLFNSLDDEYLKQRAEDIKDISKRILCHIKGISLNVFENINEDVIIIAKDLAPSDTANMDFNFVKGFITKNGGVTSHVAIIAKQLDLPAMIGVGDEINSINENDNIILNGVDNEIIINPTSDIICEYTNKLQNIFHKKLALKDNINLPAITLDSREIELFANIASLSDIKQSITHGSKGIGLFRTEFLYMNSSNFPSEEYQFEIYRNAIEENNNQPLILRTLDIGGDKTLPYYKFEHEDNPFLGLRAIRLCLELKDIFKTQLRAILRASAFGDISIMYPMIISLDELESANALLSQCKEELSNNNIDYNKNIKIGMMIETPSAVLMAEDFAKKVDFFSIGTNDLTGYILAVDRGNDKISKLYNSFNPAVLRAIKTVIDAGHSANIKVGICGEFASDEKAIPILVGLGIDELSMASVSISQTKHIIRSLNYNVLKEFSNLVCSQNSVDNVMNLIK